MSDEATAISEAIDRIPTPPVAAVGKPGSGGGFGGARLNQRRPGQIGTPAAEQKKSRAAHPIFNESEQQTRQWKRLEALGASVKRLLDGIDKGVPAAREVLRELAGFDGGREFAAANGVDLDATETLLRSLEAAADAFLPRE